MARTCADSETKTIWGHRIWKLWGMRQQTKKKKTIRYKGLVSSNETTNRKWLLELASVMTQPWFFALVEMITSLAD